MKRVLRMSWITALLVFFASVAATAASCTINLGEEYDISSCSTAETVRFDDAALVGFDWLLTGEIDYGGGDVQTWISIIPAFYVSSVTATTVKLIHPMFKPFYCIPCN